MLLLIGILKSSAFSQRMDKVTIVTSGGIRLISPLHVEGKYIKDELGQIIYLRGINKHGFEDDPGGKWQKPDGTTMIGWDASIVAANLDAMKSWGINVVRAHQSIQWWIENRGNYKQHIKDLLTMLARRGMYLIFDFYCIKGYGEPGYGQDPMPFPPYSIEYQLGLEPLLIPNEDVFVDVWRSVAEELKEFPNVIFEIMNEPHTVQGISKEQAIQDWYRVWQKCINAIRDTGAAQIIVVQWDYGIWTNLQFGDGSFMDWIEAYPFNDSLNNLVYSTHVYRNDIMLQTSPEYIYAWEYNDLKQAYQQCMLDYILDTLNKPVIMGEIGPNMWKTGEELERELAFYNNSLTIFNEWEMGYIGFWWWPTGRYAHLTSEQNYQPNRAGEILTAAISQQ